MAIARFHASMYSHLFDDNEHSMKLPEDLDKFEAADYPHYDVFCAVHVGQAFEDHEVQHNIKAIAAIPLDALVTLDGKYALTYADLRDKYDVIVEGSPCWD